MLDGRVLDAFPDTAVSDARGAIDERPNCPRLWRPHFHKYVAAGMHERHDRPGKRLTQTERRAHGNEGDGVDAQTPGDNISNDGDRKSGDHRDRRKRPTQPRQLGPAGKVRRAARGQTDYGDSYECPASGTFN